MLRIKPGVFTINLPVRDGDEVEFTDVKVTYSDKMDVTHEPWHGVNSKHIFEAIEVHQLLIASTNG